MLSPTRAITLPAASDVLLARRGSLRIFCRALPAFSYVVHFALCALNWIFRHAQSAQRQPA